MFKNLPKFVFFTGKGGVGKTSLPARRRSAWPTRARTVLLVSTDPASNVGQVFETEIGNRITAIPQSAAWTRSRSIPRRRRAISRAYRRPDARDFAGEGAEGHRGAALRRLHDGDRRLRRVHRAPDRRRPDRPLDQSSSTRRPPATPCGFFKLPGAWYGFLEAGTGDASCLGPLAGLEKQRARYAAAVERSPTRRTRLILVARPRDSALAEAARTSRELAAIGIRNQQLAINGVMPDEPRATRSPGPWRDETGPRWRPWTLTSRGLPRDTFPLRAGEPGRHRRAAAVCRRVRRDRWRPEALPSADRESARRPSASRLRSSTRSSGPGKGLVMVMGKGGVGKTTIAAASPPNSPRGATTVHLTTTDPAAHLVETLGGEVPEPDRQPHRSRRRDGALRDRCWRPRARTSIPEARAMLEEDLRSPCTEEIAVFQAFSRVIRESSRHFVVMDTAPTGHTLLLLDATGSYHRDIVRHAARDAQARIVTPMMRLRDPSRPRS